MCETSCKIHFGGFQSIFGKMHQSLSDIPREFAKSIDFPCLEVLKLNSRKTEILTHVRTTYMSQNCTINTKMLYSTRVKTQL